MKMKLYGHATWISIFILILSVMSAAGITPRPNSYLAAIRGGYSGSGSSGNGLLHGIEGMQNADKETMRDEESNLGSNSESDSNSDSGSDSCPNMLIKEGNRIYLYNTKRREVPGVNPIEFKSLEQYREFVEWQRMSGIRCPVLHVEHTLNAQGGSSYMTSTGKNLFEPSMRYGHGNGNGNKHGISSLVEKIPQDVRSRAESVMRFDQEHSRLCGDGSTMHPEFCVKDKDKFDALNRQVSVLPTTSKGTLSREEQRYLYTAKLDGLVPTSLHNSDIYAYDPMNQYIGMKTKIDN